MKQFPLETKFDRLQHKAFQFVYVHVETDWRGRKHPVNIAVDAIAKCDTWDMEVLTVDLDTAALAPEYGDVLAVLKATNLELVECLKEAAEAHAKAKWEEPKEEVGNGRDEESPWDEE